MSVLAAPRTIPPVTNQGECPANASGSLSPMRASSQKMTSPPRSATATFRHPQCTHITVDRAYGELTCSMCGRVPDMRWLYACRQDQKRGQYDPLPNLDTVPAPAQDCNFYDGAARLAEYLQMSSSVVDGIRALHYSPEQISKLIKQKQHLIQVIQQVECHMQENPAPQTPNLTHDVIASLGATPLSACQQSPEAAQALGMPDIGAPVQNCTFQACHTCRPFFQDRMYASFDTVLNGEVPRPSSDARWRKPLLNPVIASAIGLRQVPISVQRSFRSDRSAEIMSQYIDDNSDDVSVDWTPTTTGAESDSSSEHVDTSDLYPCPGPGQCPVWSRHSGCAYDNGFDDGRRAINHGYLAAHLADRLTPENSRHSLHHLFSSATDTPGGASSTASSISLPTPATSMLTSLLPIDDILDVAMQNPLDRFPRAKSAGDNVRNDSLLPRQKSNDSFGCEIEVQGGVALTEEAVRNNTPDIITNE